MKALSVDMIEPEMSLFCSGILEQLRAFGLDVASPNGRFTLLLNDKVVTDKVALTSTHGRYFFRTHWHTYIPCVESTGVYFFFTKEGTALSVGKSEVAGGLGGRVTAHIGTSTAGAFPQLRFPEAEYVVVVPFEKAPFLAPAFESSLLAKYAFQYNRRLVGDTARQQDATCDGPGALYPNPT